MICRRMFFIFFGFVVLSVEVFAENATVSKVNNNGSFSTTTMSSNILSGAVDIAKTFKPYDFKVGLGLDIGIAGLGVSALANVYRNFTPNVAGFAGVDLRYKFLQFAQSKLRPVNADFAGVDFVDGKSHFNIETRNKMDILFKLGARFKVNKNISLSPYAILGTGFGSIRQENGVVANTYSVRNIQNVYETILRNDNTRNVVINKYTDGTNKADASSYADWTTLGQNLTAQGVRDVRSGKIYHEKISNLYTIEELKALPLEDFFSLGGSVDARRNDNSSTEHFEFLFFRGEDFGNFAGITKEIINDGSGETVKYLVDGVYSSLEPALNDIVSDLGGTKFAIYEISADDLEDLAEAYLSSGEYSSVVNNKGAGFNIPTNDYLRINSGGTTHEYRVADENAYNSLKNDITNAINTYNSTKIVDNRQDLSTLNSDTTTTNAVNEVKETSTEDDASNERELIDSRNDIYVDSKQKFFFKGGLGFEMTFKDRFFVRLEYKYSKLSATRALRYYNTYNNVSGTNYYTRTYDQTTTNTTNHTYNINTSSVSPFDSGLTDGSELFDGHNTATITTGNYVGNTTTTDVTQTLPTDYTKDTGRSTQTASTNNNTNVVNVSSGSSFDMHEFSIGFGFYFL